ncbi:MAG TPA: HEAT repeat domain-containing protein [Prosthecobacter sp.]
MKTPALFWIVLIALTLGVSSAFFFMAGGPESGKPVAATASAPQASKEVKAPEAAPAAATAAAVSPLASPVAAPTSGPQEKPQILAAIEDAAVSYSAEELPKIQPYLTHPDPEVRAAAIQGMVTLGDAAAAPLLRAAAQLALSPEEATAMREAASYVELPSGSLLKKGTRTAQ